MAEAPSSLPAPPPPAGPRKRLAADSRAMLALLTVLVAYGALSNNMVLPILPALSSEFAVPPGVPMLAISAFFLGFGIGQLFYGSLSDRYGRRPVLLAGLGLYTLASAVCSLAPDMETLMAARLAQGFAAASAQVLARAIVRDLFTPQRAAKALSVMSGAFAFASAFAPLAGGVTQSAVGWQGVFLTLTSIGALSFLAVWMRFGESLADKDPSATDPARIFTNYKLLVANPVFMGYSLTFAASFAGLFAFHSGAAFVLITLLGFSPEGFGLLFAVVLAGYFAGSVFSAKTTATIGIYRLVALGILSCILAGAAMTGFVVAGMTSAVTIIGPQFLFMFGIGLILPNAIAGALAPFPEKAGAASALLGFIQQSSGGTMVAVLGALVEDTALPMASCLLAGAVLAAVIFAVVVPRRDPAQDQGAAQV